MSKKPDSSVKLFSYSDDVPKNGKGMLIPQTGSKATVHPKHTFTPQSARPTPLLLPASRVIVTIMAVCALFILGATGYGLVSERNLAAPVVTVVNPYSQVSVDLEYGPQPALAQESFFASTRDSFIEAGLSFIEVDVSTKQVRLFKKGVLYFSADVLAVGEVGSWWETPSGLYQIEARDIEEFSNIAQVEFPWQLKFGGNYIIHGIPTYPGGGAVPDDFVGGGIRLANDKAEQLYRDVAAGLPVLVRAKLEQKRDVFVYEPQVPNLDTPHYFIADIDNGTILAATDLDAEAPIASLTKLMTAVVTAEELDLDGRVQITSPTFVHSLIPRLSERSSVSMYSLLQLLLVESSNEAAETIAGEMGRVEFIEAMNAKARQLGMMHSRFADPSGLSADNVSSLGDLFRLTKYIRSNRSFILEITANDKIPSAYVGGEFDGLINFNEVEDMDNFVGGKVGETLAAGKTSISLHEVELQGQVRTLIVIILGSDDRTGDVVTLLEYVQNRFGR
ncbi:L,D-transpeptidase family protein [Candidatus Kaiserbacteria bacterium]|nr:L,D-transpeptidase family protein [Candidatus Kaiserbacteria bacterium]